MNFMIGGGGGGRGRLWKSRAWTAGNGNIAKPWLCDTIGKDMNFWENREKKETKREDLPSNLPVNTSNQMSSLQRIESKIEL